MEPDTPISVLTEFVKAGGTLARSDELRIITYFEDVLNRISVAHTEMALLIDESEI